MLISYFAIIYISLNGIKRAQRMFNRKTNTAFPKQHYLHLIGFRYTKAS